MFFFWSKYCIRTTGVDDFFFGSKVVWMKLVLTTWFGEKLTGLGLHTKKLIQYDFWLGLGYTMSFPNPAQYCITCLKLIFLSISKNENTYLLNKCDKILILI